MKSKRFFSISDLRKILKDLLIPNEQHDQVEDIRLEELLQKGYDTLLLDVDNTLLAYHQRNLSLQKAHWLDVVKSMGFTVYFISNNSSRDRIGRVSDTAKIPALFFALKPFPWALNEFAKIHYIDYRRTAIIGDQILTDVLLGNWLKIHTILIKPCGPLSMIKDIQHTIEKNILKELQKH